MKNVEYIGIGNVALFGNSQFCPQRIRLDLSLW